MARKRRIGHAVAPAVKDDRAADITTVFSAGDQRYSGNETQPAAGSTMGFLAELERQARTQKSGDEEQDRETLERNKRLANAACKTAIDYWRQLADHLNVLKPVGSGRYVFDTRNVLERLPFVNFRAEPKVRVMHGGDEHYEQVNFQWQARSGQRLKIDKELPPEMERLQGRLNQAGIIAHVTPVRNPTTGRVQSTNYDFAADVAVSARLTPDHAEGRVTLCMNNFDGLRRVEAEFPAFAIKPQLLDELSKWIVGQPNEFLKFAQNVRRYEP